MIAKRVYLSLGSNLGNRYEILQQALEALEREHIEVLTRSSLYETEPQDFRHQPWFLNMVVECETRYFPLQLLKTLQRIERELGRIRLNAVRRGPRTIDLDILLFGETVINTPELTIPHPRMLERRFVLEPLTEIAPNLRHPITRERLQPSLSRLSGQKVRKLGAES